MTGEQFTDQQLVELVERRSPHHQRMIDRVMMQAFLDGRFFSLKFFNKALVDKSLLDRFFWVL